MISKKEKTLAQLKEFGEVMALASLVFAGVGIWKRFHVGTMSGMLLGLAALFLFLAFTAPERLRGVECRWMIFAERLGTVMTWLVMCLTFFVVITPIGVLLRLLGKDLLGLKIDRKRTSYWEEVDTKAGPGTRHFLPY